MADAFLETSVLTDYLLKRDGSEVKASAKLATYNNVSVPQFSWKEFKRGPLKNFRWAHNKIVDTGSYTKMLLALQKLSMTPQKYMVATAIQAIHTFSADFFGKGLKDLEETYGDKLNIDQMLSDAMRLELKKIIYSSWNKRNSLFGGAMNALPCYPDQDLSEKKGLIEIDPKDCPKDCTCCLQADLIKRSNDLLSARQALGSDDSKRETVKRREILRKLEKHPSVPMNNQDCRNFGDGYFVFNCPNGAEIVTNNLSDIKPIADALGVIAVRP